MPYKHDYDKALTRLRVILQRLNDGEALSVKELADEFNVTTRTIQRDFNERLITSYPIYQENKKWKMQKGFKIEKIRNIEDELVLDIIEKISDSIGGNFANIAHKLLSKLKNEDFNPIYAKLNLEDISDKFNEIKIIEKAIKEKQEIDVTYKLNATTTYKTTLKPLKIINFEGFWYLLAINKDEVKKYYIKNLSHIKQTKNYFQTDKEINSLLNNSISIWFNKENSPFKIKLYASNEISKYFKRRPLSPTQIITSNNTDGSIEFEVSITHEMEILPIIKYWLPNLRVIEPKWIDDIVKEDIREYLSG
jgi:predicted DNA-binding transcriptional regulator YafY